MTFSVLEETHDYRIETVMTFPNCQCDFSLVCSMPCLIEEIEERNVLQRVTVKTILPDLIVTPISQAEFESHYSQFLELPAKEKQHRIQKLLIHCLQSNQRRNDGISLRIASESDLFSFPVEKALQLIRQDVSWSNWRTKCLALLVCGVLYQYSKYRSALLQHLQKMVFTEVIFDSHKEVRLCLYQLMEKVDQRDEEFQSACIEWLDCLISVEHARIENCLVWTRRIQSCLPQVVHHPIQKYLSLCLETPSNSLHYESRICASLHILRGVSSERIDVNDE